MSWNHVAIVLLVVGLVGCSNSGGGGSPGEIIANPNQANVEAAAQADAQISETAAATTEDVKVSEAVRIDETAAAKKKIDALPDSAKEVIALVKSGEAVPYKLLTRAVFDIHYSRAKNPKLNSDQFEDFVRDSKLEEHLDNPGAFKLAMENAIMGREKLSEIFYESEHTNLMDYFDGYMQCYSGTMMYTVMHRMVALDNAEKFKNQHPIMIFTEGHIEPGYVKRESSKWKFQRIVMTQAGSTAAHFADNDDFKYTSEAHRVYLENDVLLAEVLRFALTKEEMIKFRNEALARAAKLYDLPLAKMEERVALVKKADRTDDGTTLGAGLFGFGESKQKAGKISRSYSRNLPLVYAEKTVYHDETKQVQNPNWNPKTDSPGLQYTSVPTGRKYPVKLERIHPFFALIDAQDFAGLEKMLKGGFNPNVGAKSLSTDGEGWLSVDGNSGLHAAMSKKNLKILELLLQYGADPFATSRGISRLQSGAIFVAIEDEDYESLRAMAKSLGKKRIDTLVQGVGRYDVAYSALAYAVEKRLPKAIAILIELGADPDKMLSSDYSIRDLDRQVNGKGSTLLPAKK